MSAKSKSTSEVLAWGMYGLEPGGGRAVEFPVAPAAGAAVAAAGLAVEEALAAELLGSAVCATARVATIATMSSRCASRRPMPTLRRQLCRACPSALARAMPRSEASKREVCGRENDRRTAVCLATNQKANKNDQKLKM